MPDFGVLGTPFAQPLDKIMGAGRRREWTILCALLLKFDTHVTTDSLVDILWDDGPPNTARQQVLNCIGFLRRALEGEAVTQVHVHRVGDAYKLDIEPERIDHVAFDRRRLAAERAAERGDVDLSIGIFRSALSLWRGRVLDGLERRGLAPAASRLDELHVATAENYFQVCLDAGYGAHIVSELIEHVGDNPVRERGVIQLMVALHEAGRTHEAHGAFLRLAERLDTELGITPGPRAWRTHERILTAHTRMDGRDLALDLGTLRDAAARGHYASAP
jgi:DNA-binding SARP family transcriptional activator